jgi:hypothetical protein
MSLHIASSTNAQSIERTRQNRSILAEMIYFFLHPKTHIFVVIVGGLMVSGLSNLYLPTPIKVSWLVSLSGFYLLGFSIILFIRGGYFLPPVLVWSLILLTYGVLTSLINGVGLIELLAALRRSFGGWGLFFTAYMIHLSFSDIEKIKKFIYLLVFFQLVLCLHQYFVLVPLREKFSIANEVHLTAVDVIAGTFGAQLYGGGSNGTLALFLTIALAVLLSLKNTQINLAKYIFILIVIVTPLFLGETKIVIVYIMVVFFIIYGKNIIKNPFKFIVNAILMFSLIMSLFYIYMFAYKKESVTEKEKIANVIAHNFGDIGRGEKVLNRTTTLTFWFSEQRYFSWINTLLGHGLGATATGGGGKKKGELRASVAGSISQRYPNYGIEFTTVSITLWELGVVGILLFIGWFSSLWRLVKRIEYSAPESILYQINGLKVGVIVFFINLFAKNSLTNSVSHQILFAVFMSYLIILRYRNNDL